MNTVHQFQNFGTGVAYLGIDTVKQLPKSIEETSDLLASEGYVADRSLATLTFLSLTLNRQIFL